MQADTARPVLHNLRELYLEGNGELLNVALFSSEIWFESSFQQKIDIYD